MSPKSEFPEGWNEERVRKVLDHYENQTDEEAVAEDEAAFGESGTTIMQIPVELVAEVELLLSKHDK